MKYIRTKDGQILEVFDWEVDEEKQLLYFTTDKGYFDSKDLHPQKQHSDTIKELCDEFIIRIREDGYLILDGLKGYEKILSLQKEIIEEQASVYGAIWTNKGLIYVAKMNDKGVLELV